MLAALGVFLWMKKRKQKARMAYNEDGVQSHPSQAQSPNGGGQAMMAGSQYSPYKGEQAIVITFLHVPSNMIFKIRFPALRSLLRIHSPHHIRTRRVWEWSAPRCRQYRHAGHLERPVLVAIAVIYHSCRSSAVMVWFKNYHRKDRVRSRDPACDRGRVCNRGRACSRGRACNRYRSTPAFTNQPQINTHKQKGRQKESGLCPKRVISGDEITMS